MAQRRRLLLLLMLTATTTMRGASLVPLLRLSEMTKRRAAAGARSWMAACMCMAGLAVKGSIRSPHQEEGRSSSSSRYQVYTHRIAIIMARLLMMAPRSTTARRSIYKDRRGRALRLRCCLVVVCACAPSASD